LKTLEARLRSVLPPPRVGKVRDTYDLKARQNGRPLMLSHKTKRWSAFDFNFGFPIPGKGEALNAFDIAARGVLFRKLELLDDDMVAYGSDIDKFLPKELQNIPELHREATIVEKLEMVNGEQIVRGYLTGNALKAYKAGKAVSGHELPEGLIDGSKLAEAIFTPTTKAKQGHDEPRDYREVIAQEGPELPDTVIKAYRAYYAWALERGVILVDVKFELGRRKMPGSEGRLVFADEILTPDSSRFWDAAEYKKSFPKKVPEAMDKEIGRIWARSVGVDKLDPKKAADRRKVLALHAPPEVVKRMQNRIEKLFKMLYGKSIKQFQEDDMGIRA